MMVKTQRERTVAQTFLLDKAKDRAKRFAALRPKVISSHSGLHRFLECADKESLWISYEPELTSALLRRVSWPARNIGMAVLSHAVSPATLPALANCFKRFAYASPGGFLPPDELAAALKAEKRTDLFIGGNVDSVSQTATFWRGNLEPLTVPLSAFEPSGDGITPDFTRFSVADCGQTVRFGPYEAASDALLYEFDADYRRRVMHERLQTERSFAASLRRLRKQRGLSRDDFSPGVAAKTIARIEQEKVHRIRKQTLAAIAQRLRVKPAEIETY